MLWDSFRLEIKSYKIKVFMESFGLLPFCIEAVHEG